MTFSSLLPPLLPTSRGEPALPGFTGRRLLASLPEGISRSILYSGSRDARSQPVAACELQVKAEAGRALERDGVFPGTHPANFGKSPKTTDPTPTWAAVPALIPMQLPSKPLHTKGAALFDFLGYGTGQKKEMPARSMCTPQLGLSEPVLGRCEM